ncbi:DUF309 domain-containing protein [Streptomyces sp. NPDC089919]|uniref:DUF309 domain-containing protein n=1 Tax=Streptomyces sp. NPDC089919 TaxID=3155188 RepID=UPI0034476F07
MERRGERDRDGAGRARNARPRDGLGRPLPYGAEGVERQPEGVVRAPAETVREAQRLLDAGRPFHAHEVFEDAWKSRPAAEAPLWRALAQLAVGLTHAARGNRTGGARLLRRGAQGLTEYADGPAYGMDPGALASWGRALADRIEAAAPPGPDADSTGSTGPDAPTTDSPGPGSPAPVDAAAEAPRLAGGG